uniref:H15 domain-containing protein n=1 Tax=Bos mutus grunniens TaxID=30521 RepID=A0A8B9XQ69_BOSMU
MSETAPVAPAAPAPAEKTPVKKKAKKSGVAAGKRKASGPPVSELITKAVAASKERSGVSLAALKKALAAAGYDVEKNNSRIKLGLKSLVSKGTLVQTKGTGASGSFKLNKKAATGRPIKKPAAAKNRKLALSRDSKSPKNGKANKRAKKPRATAAQKAARNGRKAKRSKDKQREESSEGIKPRNLALAGIFFTICTTREFLFKSYYV